MPGSETKEGDQEGQLQMCDKLELLPDFSTLRIAPWLKNEAYVISDLVNPENGQAIEYSPRHIFKTSLSLGSKLQSAQLKKLTFQLIRQSEGSPPICDHLTSTNQGVLMTDTTHRKIMQSFLF